MPLFIVGLTGGIASGKSTVSRRLQLKGAGIIDADVLGHEVILRGTEGHRRLLEAFGEGITGNDGEISRPALAAAVFGDQEKVARLNSITHPLIGQEIFRRMEEFRAEKGEDAVVVLDAALLVEAGMLDFLDMLVVVAADPEVQVERLSRDRSMPEEEARARIGAQLRLEEKVALADRVIVNEGTIDELEAEVDAAWEEIALLAARKAQGGGTGA